MPNDPFKEIDELEKRRVEFKSEEELKDTTLGTYGGTSMLFKAAEAVLKMFGTFLGGLISVLDNKKRK